MRDARINPVAGDVLAIGMKEWRVDTVNSNTLRLVREGCGSWMHINYFRAFFKLASTVRYGDEGK